MLNDMFGSLLPDKLCEEVYFWSGWYYKKNKK